MTRQKDQQGSRMPQANELMLCFYGDDFTGSTASLECAAQAGARSVLFLQPPTAERLARYPGLQVLGVAGMTRSMTPNAMESVLRPAFNALKSLGAPHVHYKVCSTFDSSPAVGSIGKAIEVAMSIFEAPFVPLLVAAPALGRYCLFGNLFARLGLEGEVYRLDRHPSMSRHPTTPADESDLRLHLAHQTAREIALFDILKLMLPAKQAHAELDALVRPGPRIVLFDILRSEQLRLIGQLLDFYGSRSSPLFSVGSSAVEEALAAHWAGKGYLKGVQEWPVAGRAEPLLVASGSCSPVTGSQIQWALQHGYAEVPLDTVRLAAGKESAELENAATDAAVKHVQAGRGVIVHTSKGSADPRMEATARLLAERGLGGLPGGNLSGQLLGGALGRVIRGILRQTGVRRVVIAGGDTAGYAASALGIEALEMLAPLTPGAPLCRADAPGSPAHGLELNFKGGQIGPVNYFAQVASGHGVNEKGVASL